MRVAVGGGAEAGLGAAVEAPLGDEGPRRWSRRWQNGAGVGCRRGRAGAHRAKHRHSPRRPNRSRRRLGPKPGLVAGPEPEGPWVAEGERSHSPSAHPHRPPPTGFPDLTVKPRHDALGPPESVGREAPPSISTSGPISRPISNACNRTAALVVGMTVGEFEHPHAVRCDGPVTLVKDQHPLVGGVERCTCTARAGGRSGRE